MHTEGRQAVQMSERCTQEYLFISLWVTRISNKPNLVCHNFEMGCVAVIKFSNHYTVNVINFILKEVTLPLEKNTKINCDERFGMT